MIPWTNALFQIELCLQDLCLSQSLKWMNLDFKTLGQYGLWMQDNTWANGLKQVN